MDWIAGKSKSAYSDLPEYSDLLLVEPSGEDIRKYTSANKGR
jgi:hypothetical protein